MNISSSKPLHVQDLQRTIADVAHKPLLDSQLERKSNAVSLFKSIQDRAIRGCGLSGSVAENLRFLSTLESRQLLTSTEVLALSRAVLKGECIISPEQCKFPLSINLLRWLSGYLRIMEKSPVVKMAVEKIITNAPIHSAVDFLEPIYAEHMDVEEIEDLLKECSMHEFQKINNELRSVQAQCDKYILENQSVTLMTDETKKHYLKGLLSPILARLGQHWLTYSFSRSFPISSFKECSFATIHANLVKMINILDDAIQYSTCMHERIDRLDINKVLIVQKKFCELVKLIAFQRLPDENIPCLDDMEVNKLFDTGALLDRSYAELMKYKTIDRSHWRNTCSSHLQKSEIIPMVLGEKNLRHLFINYMGIHLELDFDASNSGVEQLNFSGLCSAVLGPRFWSNSNKKFLGDVYQNRSVEHCYAAFQDWLYDHKVGYRSFEAETLFHQLWGADHSKVDDITWLVSLIARAGLVPEDWFHLYFSSENPILCCRHCGFSGNFKKVKKSGLSDRPAAVRQLASELIHLLQQHKKDDRRCHLAQSIDPQRLWNEKYEGRLPSGY